MIHNQSHEDAIKALFTHYDNLHNQPGADHVGLVIAYNRELNALHDQYNQPLPPVVLNDEYEPEPEPKPETKSERRAIPIPIPRGNGVNNFGAAVFFIGMAAFFVMFLLMLAGVVK